MNWLRVLVDTLFFAGLFFIPWWFLLPVAIFSIFYFERYYEILFLGFLYDLLYGAQITKFFHLPIVALAATSFFYFTVEYLKSSLLVYVDK